MALKDEMEMEEIESECDEYEEEDVEDDEVDFETHLESIKRIAERLSSGDLRLKEGIELYQEAKDHVLMANKILQQAELDLKDILK